MTGHHNSFQVRKDLFARQFPQDLVSNVKGSGLRVVQRCAAAAPRIGSIAFPIQLFGCQLVSAAASIVRGESWGDNYRIVQSAGQKGSGKNMAKVAGTIAARALHQYK